MIPPRCREFGIGDLDRLDDEALRTFLDPVDGGIRPSLLGQALHGQPSLGRRVASALPVEARVVLAAAMRASVAPGAREAAERQVVERLFWPLLYWHDPDGYIELTAGEDLPAGLIGSLPIDGRVVADLGAGAGRFTMIAARRASKVIAVDAVPALLDRLQAEAAERGLGNIETRRGGFRRLPLTDRSVDVAVFCSSFHSHGPHGGEAALAEAERIVRPGGAIAVIWPENADWLSARGFSTVSDTVVGGVRFSDPDAAERICRDFYGEGPAGWVRRHRASEVPFSVLDRPSSHIACIRDVE